MNDLRSKLAMYKTTTLVEKKPLVDVISDKDIQDIQDIQDLLSGELCQNDQGSCFLYEQKYPFTYIHGGYRLGNLSQRDTKFLFKIFSEISRDSDDSTLMNKFLFLDTETTGLSSGTGTVAFLVGVGYFEEGYFVLRQYFMRDYDEECSLLHELTQVMKTRPYLVTFNGKSFDWNLLISRYASNRMRPAIIEPIHLDLLYPSRRLWKLKLESCRLCVLEEKILSEYRVDDIPGAMIPSLYFKYLEDRDASEMVKVLKHNESDIISMVALLNKILDLVENPIEMTDRGHELMGVGGIFHKDGSFDESIVCFEACMDSDIPMVRDLAYRKLSDGYKKAQDYKRAVEHWEKTLSLSQGFNIHAAIELMKYFEHKEKNYQTALQLAENALQNCRKLGMTSGKLVEDITKRVARVESKIAKIGRKPMRK